MLTVYDLTIAYFIGVIVVVTIVLMTIVIYKLYIALC